MAIIGILAAIAIPNLLASKRSANEGSATGSMRTIHSAQATYRATAGDGAYGTLTALSDEKLIDSSLGAGSKSGYTFECVDTNLGAGPPANYFATAIPTLTGNFVRTGHRSFVVAEDGVLRSKVTDSAAANHTDAVDSNLWPPLNN